MDYLKKLLHVKRVLAMVLAVTVIVTSVPTTALAAPADDEQSVTEMTVDETALDDDDTSDEESAVTEEPTDEEVVSEVADETPDAADQVQPAAAETPDAVTDDVETYADGDAQADAQYTIDVTGLVDDINAYNYTVKEYTGAAQFVDSGTTPNSSIRSRIYVKKGKENLGSLYYGYDEDGTTVDYTWKKGDGSALPEGTSAPTNAGDYKLTVSLKETGEGGKTLATSDPIDFTITQAVVTVTLDDIDAVAPDSTVAALKEKGLSIYYVSSGGFTYGANEGNDISVSIAAVREAGALDENGKEVELADTDKFVKNKSYVVIPKVEFVGDNKAANENNYKLECKGVQIYVGDLLETRVKLTVPANAAYTTTTPELSDGSTVTAVKIASIENADSAVSTLIDAIETEVDEVVTKEVEKEDGTKDKTYEYVKIDGADVTGAWHTAVYSDYTVKETEGEGENAKTVDKTYASLAIGGELDAAPSGAGTYAYVVSYAGDDEVYASSEACIVVEIGTVELIVKPVLSEDKFFDGQTVADVLAKVTPAVLYADGTEFTIPSELKGRFWGTGFNVDRSTTQPYEPVFEVVKTTKDGVETVFDPEEDQYEILGPSEEGTTYAVRFTGKKAIYYADGNAYTYYTKGINEDADSWNGSYQVLVDDKTLADNIATFTVSGKSGIIDIDLNDLIGGDVKAETVLSAAVDNTYKQADETYTGTTKALTTDYDGDPIFGDRASYKKAVLKDAATGAVVSDDVAEFTYTWYAWTSTSSANTYYYRDYYMTVDDAVNKAVAEGEKDTVYASFLNNSYWTNKSSRYSNYIPYNAGIYKLVISYNDPTGEYAAEDVLEVYFVIEKQELVLAMDEATYSGFSGVTAGDFIENLENTIGIGHSVAPANEGNPSKAEQWKNYADLEEDEDYDYAYLVNWGVQHKVTVTDPEDPTKTIEDWVFLGDYETLEVKKAGTEEDEVYRITAKSGATSDSNFAMYIDLDHDFASVTIAQSGDKEIKFDADKYSTVEMEYNGASIFKDADIAKVIEDINSLKPFYTPGENDAKTAVTGVSLTYRVEYEEGGSSKEYEGSLPGVDTEDEWALSAINGGTYTIYASFMGDGTYAPMVEVEIATIMVTKKKLEIYLPELTVKTGATGNNVAATARTEFAKPNVASVNEDDVVDGDIEKYFTKAWDADYDDYTSYPDYTYPAWGGYSAPTFAVFKDKTRITTAKLTEISAEDQEATYTLKLLSANLQGVAARNYEVVAEDVAITVIRSYSIVDTTDNYVARTAAVDEVIEVANDSWRHDFRTLAAVPWNSYNGVAGNWIEVSITAPAQYNTTTILNTAVYKQAIEDQGGTITYQNYGVIRVLFNLDEKKDNAVFNIRWDDEYIEQFNLQFKNSERAVNLEYAVAPKSLAFNSPKKSMVVGEVQKLDVKVTKQQISDIICLGYEVTSGQNYLHIDEYGEVTALGKGTATVEVYAMHMVNGVKVKFEGKDAKKATVKITVKDVAARKISKVTPSAQSVYVQYAYLNDADANQYANGYRREIYVLEGSRNAAYFETKIGEMKNEQWQGIFATKPVFTTDSEYPDPKTGKGTKTVRVYLGNDLEPNTSYTVYVRNVSAVRTLGDGCQVQESHAGSVKTFKTTKPQLQSMWMSLKLKNGTTVDWYDYDDDGYLTVDLSDGSAQIVLDGYFPDLKNEADAGDTVKYPLPLKDKTAKSTYAAPKIAYSWTLHDNSDDDDGDLSKEDRSLKGLSDVVTISKSGKITLKQPTMSNYDYITIYAEDTVSGAWDYLDIHIVAEANSIKAKKASLSAGQSIALEKLVDYKQGNKTLDQTYYYVTGRIDRQSVAEKLANSNILKLTDGFLRAYDKGSVPLTLTDTVLKKSVNVTVKTSAMAAVKSLSVINVIDNKATVQFERNDNASAYRVDVCDARGKIVRSVYYTGSGSLEGTAYEGVYGWRTGGWYRHVVGTGKKQKTYLTYRFDGLAQQSKYTVKVTAYYAEDGDGNGSNDTEVHSNTVSKAFTTTKMPAAESPLSKNATGNTGINGNPNISIDVRRTSGTNTGNTSKSITTANLFVSGNTYTLVASPASTNRAAQYAATDTLTWTSSDKKVATVKANAGSYNATLKAVKSGTTTIEVKSKILKQVIARYKIDVRTVGDAYSGNTYYGDENLRKDEGELSNTITKELKLGIPDTIEINDQGTSVTYKFEAPLEGTNTYRVVVRGVNGSEMYSSTLSSYSKGNPWQYSFGTSYKNATIWVEFVPTGEDNKTALKLNESKKAVSGQWFVFTAPADGYYKFANSSSYIMLQSADGSGVQSLDNMYKLAADQTVYIIVNSNTTVCPSQVNIQTLTEGSAVTFKATSYTPVYFSFKPKKDDSYKFEFESDNYLSVNFNIYDSTDLSNVYNSSFYSYSSNEDGAYTYTLTTNNLDPEKEYLVRVNPNYSGSVTMKASQANPATTD